MAMKSRTDLKGMFKNGSMPAQRAFAHLIDSMLNKQDDDFMGKWRPGVAYRTGDVVIYNNALWTVPPDPFGEDQEICSKVPPGEGEDWESLILPKVDDEDWAFDKETGIMYAKVFDRVGIGFRFTETSNIPEATLDIENSENGRLLILPKGAEMPTLGLFRLVESSDKTYFLTGIDETETGLTTDAPKGFTFRRGMFCEPGEEANLDFRDGQVLMVIQPGSNGLPLVGIGVPNPLAMLHITDQSKGEFLFNPEDKEDPAFTIVNLDPDTAKNYLASGVGAEWATLVSDAPKGFIFKLGGEYGEFCAHEQVKQGQSLMVIRHDEEVKPRVGIGTEEPCAALEITETEKGQFVFRPQAVDDPLFSIINLDPADARHYLASGVTGERSEWMTDAPKGFAFKRGAGYDDPCSETDLSEGAPLMVILPEGEVGIGTEEPYVRLEVTDNRENGRFLFNLKRKVNPSLAILNTRPGIFNYLTMGASDQTSIFITNSVNGFSFRMGGVTGKNDNELDIDQNSETLFRIRPQRNGGDSPLPREMRIFPEASGSLPPIVEIKGKTGIYRTPRNYELDIHGTTRSFGHYINTDSQKMDNVSDLRDVLPKVLKLKPKTFEWSKVTGVEDEGPQIGMFAHEVEQEFPELVKETPPDPQEDQTKSIDYSRMTAVLIQTIKELHEEIDTLKQRIDALEGNA